MKYSLLALFLGVILWLSNSAGAGNVQGIDRTGSPISPGACDACHAGGNFSPTLQAELLSNGTAVTQYQPNTTYTLRVRVNASNNPARYGFQAVALTGAANVKAGSFGTAPTGFRKTTIQNREYIEHSTPRTSNTMDFPWTSPATAGEEIRFYAAAIASNNANGSLGDSPTELDQALVISPLVSSSREEALPTLSFEILGQSFIRLSSNVAADYQLTVFSTAGTPLSDRKIRVWPGQQEIALDLDGLPAGIYIVSLTDGRARLSRKIIHQG
jgi:hypothetical protein